MVKFIILIFLGIFYKATLKDENNDEIEVRI